MLTFLLNAVLLFVLVFCIALTILLVIEKIHPMKWTCEALGWHDGAGAAQYYKPGDIYLVNLTSTCSKCGREVMQDGQGNWF